MNNAPTLYVERFTIFQRFLHLLVIISFLTLAVTGMVLKFAMENWAQWVAEMAGGFAAMGALHRLCAVITFLYFGLALWLIYRNWRESGKSAMGFILDPEGMVPNLNDAREIAATFKWFFGGPRPYYGRWTYWEKFDFWAVFWGVAVIGLTGLALWFPEGFSRIIPGYWLNVATIIHSDEAMLATGFIFVIHFYNTHLRPEKFPLDPVIFVGSVPLEELKYERPREYDQLVASGELDKVTSERGPEAWQHRAARVFGLFVVITGSLLIIAIIVSMARYIAQH
ncbi:MAG: hypothetical protein U5J62_10675 [Desulfurivibrio sp.]|nr:hypothetical protein [Desulfurivibrio sp.]